MQTMIEPFAGHGGLNHTTPGALGVEDLGMSSIRKIASIRNRCVPALAVIAVCGGAGSASAQDFFSTFFGGFMQPPPMRSYLPYANDGYDAPRPARPRVRPGGRQAFCVRTCDGRYFPLSGGRGQSRAASCDSFCPASDTEVFYGANIDRAVSRSGKPYASLANAFRYRNEIVKGCTCNGKDQFGLARIDVDHDPTLRKGDIVAGADGLMVARGRAKDARGASLNFSPAPRSVRARFARLPVIASE